MKSRKRLAYMGLILVVAAAAFFTLEYSWRMSQQQPAFDAPKLISAVQAFSRDVVARGEKLPSTVSLRELIGGNYVAGSDVRAFDGMDVTISLLADKAQPQEVLMRVRLPDGTVTALMADGSVQGLRK